MKLLISCFILVCNGVCAQGIVNLVMIDAKNQVTTKPETAQYFIVVKRFGDSSFERLEYKFAGSRMRSIHYSDAGLTIKQGTYHAYGDSGIVILSGQYVDNKKSGTWYDAITEKFLEYKDDVLISERFREPKDTTKSKSEHKIEVESAYPGGSKSYFKFLDKNFQYPDRALKLQMQGTVVFQFMIDTEGKLSGPEIVKSVEFSIDEEVLRLAYLMPKWIPATQDGKTVKSYKKQPVTLNCLKFPLAEVCCNLQVNYAYFITPVSFLIFE